MKREKISTALSEINDIYLEKAENYHAAPKKHLSWRWTALAASLALVITCTALLSPQFGNDIWETKSPENSISWDEQNKTYANQAVWSERAFTLSMTEKYKSYVSKRVIDEEYVGDKIDEIEIKAFWFHALDQTETDITYIKGDVYEIKGVSPDAAVCVRYTEKTDFLTTTHYYTFLNTEWKPESIQEFYTVFDAKNHLSLGKDLYTFIVKEPSVNGAVSTLLKSTSNTDAAALLALLLETDGAAIDFNYTEDMPGLLENCKKQVSFRIDLPTSGTFIYVNILDNGYLDYALLIDSHENFPHTLHFMFEIGAENAANIIDFIESNAEEYTASSDGTDHTITRYETE